MCCKKCTGFLGMLVLVVGVLFLLRDLNLWNFWGIQWYTVVFLIAGLGAFFSSGCPECQNGCCEMPSAGKKAKKGKKK